ncbi:MAG TPA: hypothetical protein VKV69_10515 [Actinomycetota bacterium]|nr:hypothetical protein [Actinomycetota bacterium]
MKSARGGIVLGWIFKIIVLLAILGVASFETGAIIISKVTADRVAIDAAQEAGRVYAGSHDIDKAREAAKQIAAKDGVIVTDVHLIAGGKYIQITVSKKASTFLVQHIGFLKRFATAKSTHVGLVQ